MASRVEVGGVDEIAAEFDVAVDDLLGLFDTGAPAEVLAECHRAQTQGADPQAGSSESGVLIQRHESGFLVNCSIMRLFTIKLVHI